MASTFQIISFVMRVIFSLVSCFACFGAKLLFFKNKHDNDNKYHRQVAAFDTTHGRDQSNHYFFPIRLLLYQQESLDEKAAVNVREDGSGAPLHIVFNSQTSLARLSHAHCSHHLKTSSFPPIELQQDSLQPCHRHRQALLIK